MILDTVKETIAKHKLLNKKDKILLAYSGGLDSTGLVAVFLELRKEWLLELFLAHFNHRLRPSASADEQFVRKMAQEHELPLYVASEDVRAFAKQNRLNLEEAGRTLRYDFLSKTAQKIGGAKIATGHTLNDQAETFFMRLLRGSGPKGLGSISPVVEGRIIRPLLWVERKDIAEYVQKMGLAFCEDESNLDRRFTRNKIRLDLIPYIQENFQPKIVRQLGKVIAILQEEDIFLERWASEESKKTIFGEDEEACLDLKVLSALPKGLARRVVRKFIHILKGDLREISFDDVEALLDLDEGQSFQMTKDLLLKKDKDFVSLRSETFDRIVYDYTWDGLSPLTLEELNMVIEAEKIKRPRSFDFNDNVRAYLDGEKIKFPLQVRSRREGDRYRPLGAPGNKKLKEIMRAKRIPLSERNKKPVFLAGDDIIWIYGLPVGEKFQVKDQTKEVLVLTVALRDQR